MPLRKLPEHLLSRSRKGVKGSERDLKLAMAASSLANTLDTARSGDSDIFSMGSFYEKMSNPPMSPTATAGQSMTDVLAASYAGAAGANNGVTPVAATALLTHTSGDILEAKYRDKSVEEVKLAMTRLEWMLRYHTALTLYHLNQYETAIEVNYIVDSSSIRLSCTIYFA
jgi:hypothetical protein